MVLAIEQVRTPLGGVFISTLLALIPVILLLVLLAVFRVTAWLSVLIGSVVTILLAILVWQTPLGPSAEAYFWGSLTGIWAVNWIVFWGVVIYYTLVATGVFETFKNWLIQQATADIRVQTLLLAWAFGALLEGLVGFGYPWAVVAPILVTLGVKELDAIRVAAIANNAPVSYGALGAPIIALAAITGLEINDLSASIGKIVAVLALLPPWILIYLVSGRRGLRDGWPLAIVASLAYIAGQFPVSQFLGPYLPDIVGGLVCFVVLIGFLKVWRPKTLLGYGGEPIEEEATRDVAGERMPTGTVLRAVTPFLIIVAVVVAWTGPWSSLPDIIPFTGSVATTSSLSGDPVEAVFEWKPFIAGTSILAAWLLIVAFLRPKAEQLREAFTQTFSQVWGALLVGVFIFGLAYVFNFSGMGASLAFGFSKVGTPYLLLAPILGWIGVALSGSNTSTNALFGAFQLSVGKLLGFPLLLLPSLNSVGAEIGKPVAPQTASVGVSTSKFVRDEGAVIRHNMGWTLFLLAYLILLGVIFYFFFPGLMET